MIGCQEVSFMSSILKAVPKINVVILSEAKNLFFIVFLKEEILRTYALRMTQKGKLTRIFEHS
jgi:hypothetical protein